MFPFSEKLVHAQETTTSQTTYYFSPVFEKTDGVITKYYPLPGNSTAARRGADLNFLHTDHLSSTRLTTDNSGRKTAEIIYFPYGSIFNQNTLNLPSDRLYTSQILDSSTDFYFYHARQYNPRTASFISADSAQGPNRYAYVSSNPISRNDPSGNVLNYPGLKNLFSIPTTPNPNNNALQNLKYMGLAAIEQLYNFAKTLSQIDPFLADINDPYFESLLETANSKAEYQWARFNLELAQQLPLLGDVQVVNIQYTAAGGEKLFIDPNKDKALRESLENAVESIKERRTSPYISRASLVQAEADKYFSNPSNAARNAVYNSQGGNAWLSQLKGVGMCREQAIWSHGVMAEVGMESEVAKGSVLFRGKWGPHAWVEYIDTVSSLKHVLDTSMLRGIMPATEYYTKYSINLSNVSRYVFMLPK